MRYPLLLTTAGLALSLALPALGAEPDWTKVADAVGKPGMEMPGGVYRVGMPRTDLHVTLHGAVLKPTFALGSWLAFKPAGNQAMVMGDLVLTQDEIRPVMTKFAEGGIQITALHNHLLHTRPAIFYMHVLGQGDPVKLAAVLHSGLAASKTPFGATAASANHKPSRAGATTTLATALDTAMIDHTLSAKGQMVGGVYQIGIPRAEAVHDGGMVVPASMGSAEAINFQPTGAGRAAITGDFVLTAKEVNPVLLTLLEHGIEVTALHNHMLGDTPRLFFMHFWADGDTAKLAQGLRAALDKVDVAKS